MPIMLAAVVGALAPFLLSAAPPGFILPCLASCGLLLATRRRGRLLGALLLGFCWTLLAIQCTLDDRLDPGLDGEQAWVTGFVAGLPVRRGESLEFLFKTESAPGSEGLPRRISVRWHRDAPDLRVGEKWRLGLRLQPPRSRVNFAGPDTERWYFSQRIGARATVRGDGHSRLQASRGAWRERARQDLRERISAALQGHPARGLVLALAVADRSEVSPVDWRGLTLTGTGHLVAISGMHVGLASLLGYWLGRLVLACLPWPLRLRAGMLFPWVCAMTTAVYYAALAGFGTSTRRALIMLLVLCLARLSRRFVSPSRPFMIALVAVLLANPLAPLQAGFWMSFGAVLVLLCLHSARHDLTGRIRPLLAAQAAITVNMLPLSMYWFQQGTLLGLLANIAAIPWVSFVVVPLVLAGAMLALFESPLAVSLLHVAAEAGNLLVQALNWLAKTASFGAFSTARPGLIAVILAFGGALLLLLPRGMPLRWLAPFLVAPLLLPGAPARDRGGVQLDLLDVGQGLSALVSTRRHTLLFDSGPGQPGAWDLAGSVIRPALGATSSGGPDRIIISHGDLDHAGGVGGLQDLYPDAEMFANLGSHRLDCVAGLAWSWDAVDFRVLHPGHGLPYLGNSSSCVVSIRARHGAILLTGDIDAAVEARLVSRGLGRHELVVAPHHGSRTSSSPELIRRTAPVLALFSAGAGNRFGFPHTHVLRRYREAGAVSLATSDCGAIRVDMGRQGHLQVQTARRARAALWRWPPRSHCP